MTSEQSQRSAFQDGRAWGVSIALLVLTLAVYLPVLQCHFVSFDDPGYVTANAAVRAGLNGNNARWAFSATVGGFWQPLTILSHMLDCDLYGLKPAGHHLTNLLLHAANVLLLFWILRAMTGSVWRSALVAALFALHPLNVESVAWVAERKNVLSTFFFLVSMAFYARYARRLGLAPYLLALAAFACGLMSKASVITLPFVLLLLDFWPLRRVGSWSRLFLVVAEKAPMFVLCLVSALLTFRTQTAAGAVVPAAAVSWVDRVSYAVVNYVLYIDKMIWPSKLAVLYPMWTTPVSLRALLICLVLLVFVTVAVVRRARRFPYFAVGWLWYLGTLVPMVGLVLVGSHSIADRFMYIPMLGIFLMIVWGAADFVEEYPRYRAAVVSLAMVALVALGWTTRAQLRHWRDSLSLFTRAVEVTNGNYIMHEDLGREYVAAGNLDQAIDQFAVAVRINEAYLPARENLALALMQRGRLKEAIAVQLDTAARFPLNPDVQCDLGCMLADVGRKQEATACLMKALWLNPGLAKAHYRVAQLALEKGQLDQAYLHLTTAVQLKPDSVEAKKLLDEVSRKIESNSPPKRGK